VEDLEEVSVGVPGSVPIRREAGVDGEARFRERQLGIAREEITVKPVERAVYRRYVQIYETAAKRYGFGKDWYVLAAVGKVESDHGGNMGPSSAGAMGPMQFLPSTWKDYGLDGNGDGLENIMDPEDAVPAAAAYLRRGGAPGDWEAALYSYNHSDVYVRKVLKVADRYRERDDSADKGAEVTW
jgi:membrane-bound lytic murein transglycosylase B